MEDRNRRVVTIDGFEDVPPNDEVRTRGGQGTVGWDGVG
jgi:hypothetical protein